MKRRLQYPIIGLISSKNPSEALVLTVTSLLRGGAERVIVVNDGSNDPTAKRVFRMVSKAGGEVIHLKKNIGKAAALKEGFALIPPRSIIMQVDDDALSGDLSAPAEMIRSRRADIIDIRIESARTRTVVGRAQEMSYWFANAIIKRGQDVLRARLWVSGCSLMYTHRAGKELIMRQAQTVTEDTEGLFRARKRGFSVRYCAAPESTFVTMVPEDFRGLRKQWQRWAIGCAQVMMIYGFGNGNPRIATVNVITWLGLVAWPVASIIVNGIMLTLAWWFFIGLLTGLIAAIRLNRPYLGLTGGIIFPLIGLLWTYHAIEGFWLAFRRIRSRNKDALVWVSPKRSATIEA